MWGGIELYTFITGRVKRASVDIGCIDCHNDYTTPDFARPEIYAMFK